MEKSVAASQLEKSPPISQAEKPAAVSPAPAEGEYAVYKDSTYEVVSMIAYLIGVPKRIFEREQEPPKMDVYERMDKLKPARIVRHLCIIRTAIERNFKSINDKMHTDIRSIFSMPEYVPTESLTQLNEDGIVLSRKPGMKLSAHVVEINKLLSNRLNNCKPYFPLWLNWQYVRDLFIMPDGLNEEGTKEAASVYYSNRSAYPYQMYINWQPKESGNILYNDKKFVTLLYGWHKDKFTEYSKVSDAGAFVKDSIYDYISDSGKIVVVVDCENSDPYKLSATLKRLDYDYTKKISRIILFDDVHTASAWEILEKFTKIPVEHILIERVKQNKSLVDIKLTVRACQEYYENHVDSFIIVSSDSDYWGLISSLPQARFLVMVEHEKCGPDMKNALVNSGIFYCYLDDFYSGDTEEIKLGALFREMYRYIDKAVQLNVNTMFDEALRATRIEMTPAEKQQFYAKYIRTMQMSIGEDGNVSIEIKVK